LKKHLSFSSKSQESKSVHHKQVQTFSLPEHNWKRAFSSESTNTSIKVCPLGRF